jgi:hypothetical protein
VVADLEVWSQGNPKDSRRVASEIAEAPKSRGILTIDRQEGCGNRSESSQERTSKDLRGAKGNLREVTKSEVDLDRWI